MTDPTPLKNPDSYWKILWNQFKKNRIGLFACIFLLLFCLVGLYAPFFASSKPSVVIYNHQLYFPLFRYLFYTGFYTKPIDLFYNLLMITLPIGLLGVILLKKGKKTFLLCMLILQMGLFFLFSFGIVKDPASNRKLLQERQAALNKNIVFRQDPLLAPFPKYLTWDFELKYMNDYEKLNRVLRYRQRKLQNERLQKYAPAYFAKTGKEIPTLWEVDRRNNEEEKKRLEKSLSDSQKAYEEATLRYPELLAAYRPFSHQLLMTKIEMDEAQKRYSAAPTRENEKSLEETRKNFETASKSSRESQVALQKARSTIIEYQQAEAQLSFLKDQTEWMEQNASKLRVIVPALIRDFHWEDDAGGQQSINQYVPWYELTRVNRKDLVAGLLFGIRISLVVGFSAVFLSLLIGIPLGTFSGYFAGKTDMIICRLIEIWEAMPTFFMLLLVVAITQSKSIFLVIGVLGIFGWTGLARFMRGEVLKQRSLPYVLACSNLGFRHPRIMFSHILPNAIPPILTLIPFSMMAAITSEAGISFLGLGEEGSTSWGVLMAEGRSVFPGESYLLWPAAILLTLLLISIALVGDALRDAIDPKMRK